MKSKPKKKQNTKKAPSPQPVGITPAREYADMIAEVGGQLIAADMLGLHPMTVARRCDGRSPLTREMFRALANVATQPKIALPV